jgi:hypothetical protein
MSISVFPDSKFAIKRNMRSIIIFVPCEKGAQKITSPIKPTERSTKTHEENEEIYDH